MGRLSDRLFWTEQKQAEIDGRKPSEVLRRFRGIYRTSDAGWVVAFVNVIAVGWVVAALFAGAAQGTAIGFAVVFVIWAVWIWQYGVRVTSRGVTVTTALRVKRIPWTEIARFELVPHDKRQYFAVVKVGERRMVMSSALCTPVRPARKVEQFRLDIQAVIDELNQLLANRGMPSTPSEQPGATS